ncbi:DUF169 domain-containing protein [Desulfocicer vacuolatum]|uniref:DUF169 domain-containing protein n=1 Tax=Desulfocicer vacuolatum TaxID=2298 RepID=UPI00148239B7|nr:DUF169 domain-containing protein [Desulfocicer vacuolatum]
MPKIFIAQFSSGFGFAVFKIAYLRWFGVCSDNLGCLGAKATLGFEPRVVTDELVDYLVNIERYHPSRTQFESYCEHTPVISASGKYIVFKR